jgi:hypothetical protein
MLAFFFCYIVEVEAAVWVRWIGLYASSCAGMWPLPAHLFVMHMAMTKYLQTAD